MEMTVNDMAKALGGNISTDAVKKRLQRKGIKPFKYVGPTGIYTDNDLAAIKDVTLGPPKAKPEAKNKTKTTAKKRTKKP
jgi:hypothetical protein